jgi:predicted O-methyltransferase YrrM
MKSKITNGILRIQRAYHRVFNNFEPRKPQRYANLTKIIEENKCRRIMEIGVLHGDHAIMMIESAKKHYIPPQIEYYGFDLFEYMNEEICLSESSKMPSTMELVRKKLESTGAIINLYRGDTKDVLPAVVKELPEMDLIVIDGGHSIETIENDWKYAQQLMDKNTMVLFDDYYNWSHIGARYTIEHLDSENYQIEILPPTDRFAKGWKILEINYAKVIRKI